MDIRRVPIFCTSLTGLEENKSVLLKYQLCISNLDAYYSSFLRGENYRECCCSCRYASLVREGDFSIGDYWGINESVIDVFDRTIIDYHIGLSCEGKHGASLIQRCMWRRKLLSKQERPVIRTDNGPQFISNVFEEACESCNNEHERIPLKTPNKNAHIESFHAILERERLTRYEFRSYQEAYQVIAEFIQFYNKRRIHGSIKDLKLLA